MIDASLAPLRLAVVACTQRVADRKGVTPLASLPFWSV
jgi:hypothetical protein